MVEVHLQSFPKIWVIKAKAFALTQDMQWCQTQGWQPGIALHRSVRGLSKHQKPHFRHLQLARCCKPWLLSCHGSHKTPYQSDGTTTLQGCSYTCYEKKNKGRGGHIIAVLKGCGEPCWQAEDWHTRAILQPQQSEVLLHSHEWDQAWQAMATANMLPSPILHGAQSCYFIILLCISFP